MILKALTVCHYVFAGLSLLGLLGIYLHYFIMSKVMIMADSVKTSSPHVNMEEFFDVFRWIYLIGGGLCVLSAVGNFLTAGYIRGRKARMFCLIMSGLNCLQIPVGIVLGIFTIIVLARDSVVELYQEK